MIKVVRRISLVEQVADLLRENIEAGRWPRHLPGQRALSRQLQVSCRTLRGALNLLAREGRLVIAHGRPTRVVPRGRRNRPRAARVVRLLISQPLHDLSQINLYRLSELRRCLMEADYTLEVHVDPASLHRQPLRGMETLVRENPAACWVLHISKPEIQRWFVERGIAAVVSKSGHEGVDLPSVDVDFRALGHHAAGLFLGLGHRRVALVVLRMNPADELAIKEGFLAGFQGSRRPDALVEVAYHNPSAKGVCQAIDEVLRKRKETTGFFVPGTGYTLTAMGYLAHLGWRIPQDVSLATQVADSPLIQYAYPSLAHYRIDWDLLAQKLARLVIRVASAGATEPRHVRLLPEFQPGDSLAAAPTR